MIDTVLCDLDGTLVDSQQDIAAAFQQAWRTVVGGTPPGVVSIAELIGKPLGEMANELGGILSPERINTFVSVYRRMFAEQNASLSRTYAEVSVTLRALSKFTLGIVTTKELGQAELVLRKFALIPFFEHIQGNSLGLRHKPAPDTLLAALAALRRSPSHALMVGDTPADILAGKAAGTKTCAVTYGFGNRDALLECAPDYVIDGFGQLVNVMRDCNE